MTPVSRWQEPGWTAENMRKPGFDPVTLVDVGAAFGTRRLYSAFPDAYLVLVEPVPEYGEELYALLQERDGEVVEASVGEAEGTVTLYVDPSRPLMSSVLKRFDGGPPPTERREVPMVTLDRLYQERQWRPPFGLKVDAEGYEHRVIEGAKDLLSKTQFVIAEVSVLERYEEGHTFAGFIALMDTLGFRLCDILEGARQESRELGYVDAMFRPA